MYINTSNDVIECSIKVPKEFTWTGNICFRMIPDALALGGTMKSAIQCGHIGGYASNRGGILLPKRYSCEELSSIKIQNEEGRYFIAIEGRQYDYSLLNNIGNRCGDYWAIDSGTYVRYHYESDIKEKNMLFEKVPSEIFYQLLSAYPQMPKGSKSSMLFNLFSLCQEQMWQQNAVSKEHLYHAADRANLRSSAKAMRAMIEDVVTLLKQ